MHRVGVGRQRGKLELPLQFNSGGALLKSMVQLRAIEKLITEISIGSSVLPEIEAGIGWQPSFQKIKLRNH